MEQTENKESDKGNVGRRKEIGKEVGVGKVGLSDLDKGAGRENRV